MKAGAEQAQQRYRPDIDGLRAVAVLAVLAYHGFPEAVRGGFVGVDVFFVISGYLITGIILDGMEQGTFTLRSFYARRVRRIFPALLLVLCASLLAGWFTLLPAEYEQLGKHTAAAAGFVSNLVLWSESGYFDRDAAMKPLLHLWSLAVEEQFYLIWPALVVAAWNSRCSRSVVAFATLASFALNAAMIATQPVATFYSPLTRFWELTLGAVLAHHARQAVAQGSGAPPAPTAAYPNLGAVVGSLLLVASVFGLSAEAAFPGLWALAPTLGTLLLIAAGPHAWLNRAALSSRPMVLVGLVSYPLYLWHWPLLSFGHILGPDNESLALRVVALAIAFVLAGLTYALVERPIRFGTRGARNVALLAAAMSTIGALGLATFWKEGLVFRQLAETPQLVRNYAALRYDFKTDARYGRCWLRKDDPAVGFSDECVDSGSAQPLLAVWGDSHAARLVPGLRAVLGPTRRLAQYTRDACPPVLGFGGDSNCARSHAFVLEKIRSSRATTLIVMAAWNRYRVTWSPDDDTSRRLLQTLAQIRQAGASHVIVVGPGPQWQHDLPGILVNLAQHDTRFHLPPERTRSRLVMDARDSDLLLRRLLAGVPGITYFSAWDAFCNEEGCLTRVDDAPDGVTTWDYGHLTTRAAVYLARRLPLAGESRAQ